MPTTARTWTGPRELAGHLSNIDALFQDPENGMIGYLEGRPGHRVNVLEVATDQARSDATASSPAD
jgi:hypothetical protein